VAINVDPDVLIVDEALSVGDMKFQQKCFLRMKRLRENNTTILLVTHDMNSLRSFASHAVWIDDGKIKMLGESETITNAYISFMTYDKTKTEIKIINTVATSNSDEEQWCHIDLHDYEIHDGATITGARLDLADTLSTAQTSNINYKGDEKVEYSLKVKFNKSIENLMIGIAIVDKKGLIIAHLNTMLYDGSSISISSGEEYIFNFWFTLPNLAKGYYSFYTNIVDGNYSLNTSVAMLHGICGFEVFPSQQQLADLNGVVYLKNTHYHASKIDK